MTAETRYLTIAETCARIGRSRWTVARLIQAGALKARKRGTARNAAVEITEASVNAYLAGQPVHPAKATA